MEGFKEYGSLDIKRINRLPYEEYMNTMGKLTQVQIEEYLPKLPIYEFNEPFNGVVDYTLEDELEIGCVIAENFINKMKKHIAKQ